MPGVTITVAYIISCYFILHTGCQIITLCSNPVKNGSCTITCTTPDTSKDVVFYLETTNKGSCFVSLSFCTTDVTQTGNVTSLAFSSLSKNAHEGSWTCNYGNLPSSPQSLIVYTEPTVTTFINESSTPPDERKKIKEVNLAARSYCFFPSVSSANLLYKDLTSSQFIKLSENSVVGVSGTSLGCETYEQDLQVNITVNIDNAQYKELAGKTVYFQITFTNALGTTYSTNELGPYAFEDQGSATTESTINLSTEVNTTTNSETSTKISTGSSTLESRTLSGSTESVNTKSETSTVLVITSPSGLSEEMIIIISTVSAVGVILLIVIIVVVVFFCRQRTSTAESEKHRNKHGQLHIKNGNKRDLNSNYEQRPKNKHRAHAGRKIQGGADLNQKHPQNILHGGRIPTVVEYPRSLNYHKEDYFPTNQHPYRNQNSPYYLPYTDPRNVMYHQRYPGSRYSEDMSGYSRAGPYRMQQFYLQPYSRQDRYTDDGLERRIGHRRGDYGSYWDNDTLY